MAADFQLYRALQKIHLGGTEPSEHIEVGEKISFNGSTVRRESGSEIKLQFPSAVKAAVNLGWLVLDSSSETTFSQKSAGIDVRSAVSTSENRSKVATMVVQDEERDLGTLSKVRPASTPPTHKASDAGKVSKGAPTGAKVIRDEVEGDGIVVGRMKTKTKFGSIEIGTDDRRVISELEKDSDTSAPVGVEKVRRAVATGDVQEARTGIELSDLLPDAASSSKPKAGVFNDEGVIISKVASSIGGQEEGQIVAKVVKTSDKPDPEAALREWASSGQVNGQTLNVKELSGLVKLTLRKIDGLRSEINILMSKKTEARVESEIPPELKVAEAALQDPPLNLSGLTVPWDMTPHWKTRAVKVITEYGDKPDILKQLLAVEAAGVKKAIEKRLVELGQ